MAQYDKLGYHYKENRMFLKKKVVRVCKFCKQTKHPTVEHVCDPVKKRAVAKMMREIRKEIKKERC